MGKILRKLVSVVLNVVIFAPVLARSRFSALRVYVNGNEEIELIRWRGPLGVKIIVPRWSWRSK